MRLQQIHRLVTPRDMHRHRRCQQTQQNFTTVHGYDVPAILGKAGVEKEYRQAMDAVHQDIDRLRGVNQEAALYAIPFGFRVRCLFKMDFAEVEYISKLRSGVKGHWSYRTVAWLMRQKMVERYPYLGNLTSSHCPARIADFKECSRLSLIVVLISLIIIVLRRLPHRAAWLESNYQRES